MSLFMVSLISCALEDMLLQFKCLEPCSNELKLRKQLDKLYLLRNIEYDLEREDISGEFGFVEEDLHFTIKKINKLESDRKYVNHVMEKVYLELALHQRFKALKEFNENQIKRECYPKDLEMEKSRNLAIRRELDKQVRHQRNRVKSVLYNTQAIINNLKQKINDFLVHSGIRYRYVEKWQRARLEQNEMTISNKEFCLVSNTDCFKLKSEYEERVHNEFKSFIGVVLYETLQNVDHLMEKYDNDLGKIDINIQLKRTEYEDMHALRTTLETRLENHNKMIEKWMKFKSERDDASLYLFKMTFAATIVQAWWRGLIVRLKLGPYKDKIQRRKKDKKN